MHPRSQTGADPGEEHTTKTEGEEEGPDSDGTLHTQPAEGDTGEH